MKLNKSNIKYDFTYLGMFLIPFEYIIGAKIYAMILIGISIFEILLLLKKNNRFPITYFTCGYFMLIIYGFISSYFTKDATSTYSILIQIIPYYIFAFVSSWYILLDDDLIYGKIKNYLRVFVYGTFVVAIYTLFVDLRNFNIYTKIGVKVFGGLQTMFSYYLIIAICIEIFLLTCEKKKITKYVHLMIIILLYGISLFTAIRKATIIPIVFCVIYISVQSFNRKKLFKGIIFVLILFVSLFALYTILMKNEHFSTTVGRRLHTFVIGMMGEEVTEGSFNTREELRNTAWQCFKANPLFGYGFGAFRDYSAEMTGVRLYAHNNFLELLASCGVFGFGIYYGSIILLLRRLLKKVKEHKNSILSFGIAFICAMFINDYGTVSYLALSYIVMFTIISCSTKIKRVENYD